MVEIIASLRDRITEAKFSGWLGEVGGLDGSLQAAARKLVSLDRVRDRLLPRVIDLGITPVIIDTAQAELEAAKAEQARTPDARTISRAEVYTLIDYHGDVGAALKREDPAELQRLYEGLDLELIYQQEAKVIEGTIRPGRDSVSEAGGAHYPYGLTCHNVRLHTSEQLLTTSTGRMNPRMRERQMSVGGSSLQP